MKKDYLKDYTLKIICFGVSSIFLLCTLTGWSQTLSNKTRKIAKEKTTFQTADAWKPTTDSRSDVAIVYGASDRHGLTFEQRAQSWRDHGYIIAFMTGIAWGDYQDYFIGKWDGVKHFDEGQVQQNGDTICTELIYLILFLLQIF